MVRSSSRSLSRGVLVTLTVFAAGLLLVPAAFADIVGSPANAGTPNAVITESRTGPVGRRT